MSTSFTTTADTADLLYQHYFAGRYPAAVRVELTDEMLQSKFGTEIAVARALGAHDHLHRDEYLPTAERVAQWVAELLDPPAAPAGTGSYAAPAVPAQDAPADSAGV